jgi:hypothetical protein
MMTPETWTEVKITYGRAVWSKLVSPRFVEWLRRSSSSSTSPSSPISV